MIFISEIICDLWFEVFEESGIITVKLKCGALRFIANCWINGKRRQKHFQTRKLALEWRKKVKIVDYSKPRQFVAFENKYKPKSRKGLTVKTELCFLQFFQIENN